MASEIYLAPPSIYGDQTVVRNGNVQARPVAAGSSSTMFDEERRQQEKDMARGRARGDELFGAGKLGRVDQNRAAEIADIIERRKANLEGYTPEEMNAFREQNVGTINQSTQGAARNLRSSQVGVPRGVAMAQKAKLLADANKQIADQERNLFISNIDRRRDALESLEKSTVGARADELGREKMNIDSMNREKFGGLATELGYANLGTSGRGAVRNSEIAKAASEAALNAAGSGGKK